MWNSEVSHITFLLSLNPSQYIYDQLRDNSGHLRTTIDQIKERSRSELGKSNPAITPHPKPEEAKPSNNQKPVETFTDQTSFSISLSQLSSQFITAKNEAGYPSKTINGYHDTHKLAISVLRIDSSSPLNTFWSV